jgi:hypothetical protein
MNDLHLMIQNEGLLSNLSMLYLTVLRDESRLLKILTVNNRVVDKSLNHA